MHLSRDPGLVFDPEPILDAKKYKTYRPRLGGIPGRRRGQGVPPAGLKTIACRLLANTKTTSFTRLSLAASLKVGVLMSLLWLIFGYLAGSCPTGYLAVKILKGQDVRNFGSGNIGATNTGRVLGKKWAVAVAVFDMLKGGIAVLLASFFTDNSLILAFTGVFAVLGHDYPVWLGWRGGKGVATTFGVFGFFDFFNPLPALIGGIVWYVVLKKTKYVSLASIAALFCSVLLMPLFNMPRSYYLAGLFLALLSAWRHKSNIQRIIEGKEDKVGKTM